MARAQFAINSSDPLMHNGMYGMPEESRKSITTPLALLKEMPTAVACKSRPSLHCNSAVKVEKVRPQIWLDPEIAINSSDPLMHNGTYGRPEECSKSIATPLVLLEETPTAVACKSRPSFHLNAAVKSSK